MQSANEDFIERVKIINQSENDCVKIFRILNLSRWVITSLRAGKNTIEFIYLRKSSPYSLNLKWNCLNLPFHKPADYPAIPNPKVLKFILSPIPKED